MADSNTPIGAAARSVYLQRLRDLRLNRINELWCAIFRYVDSGRVPELVWVAELNALLKEEEIIA